MTKAHLSILIAAVALLASACSYPERNEPLTLANHSPPYTWENVSEHDHLRDTLIIVTASGGGTRAAALAAGALKVLDHIKLRSGRSIADEVDIVSSVSGGSVTAAYFSMYGAKGLGQLESKFLLKNGMTPIIFNGLNPFGLAALATPGKERIDLFIDYLDKQLFDELTFADLAQNSEGPFLILNAADMVEGVPFPFTQYSMDLLCSDLSKMKLSTAVGASAAFPAALSPVTLRNFSTCSFLKEPPWISSAKDRWDTNPSRVAQARVASAYWQGRKKFIHLLDGGIADNLGVSEPFRLLTNFDVSPLLLDLIQSGEIKKIVFVMVNARSFQPNELDNQQAGPTIVQMIEASVGSAIDRATFSSAERLRDLLAFKWLAYANNAKAHGHTELEKNLREIAGNTKVLTVDFDAIDLEDCRKTFHSIPTNWSLSERQIHALYDIAEGLIHDSRNYADVVSLLGGTSDKPFTHVTDVCQQYADLLN